MYVKLQSIPVQLAVGSLAVGWTQLTLQASHMHRWGLPAAVAAALACIQPCWVRHQPWDVLPSCAILTGSTGVERNCEAATTVAFVCCTTDHVHDSMLCLYMQAIC